MAARKKALSPEAQRVLSVLDECVRKTDALSFLPLDLVRPESVSRELGDAALAALRHHLRLSADFLSRPDGKAAAECAVRDSLRHFLRRARPCGEAELLKEALREAGPVQESDRAALQELEAGLRELRNVLEEHLATTPREERERKRRGQEVRERQQHNADALRTLEQEVTDACKRRDELISKKDEEIRRTKDALRQMEGTWAEFVLRVQQAAERQRQSDLKNSEMTQSALREDADRLRAQLDLLTRQHREKETALRKRNNKLETEIENWIQKYDADMEEKQGKLERATRAYELELAEMHELLQRFSVLELEHSRVAEERRRERERREREDRETAERSRAAVVVQAFWRGYKVRKAMRSKAKGKKGKKGKGKKGK